MIPNLQPPLDRSNVGLFWLPDDPDKKAAGYLALTPHRTVGLVLIGQTLYADTDETHPIHGTTGDGWPVTLFPYSPLRPPPELPSFLHSAPVPYQAVGIAAVVRNIHVMSRSHPAGRIEFALPHLGNLAMRETLVTYRFGDQLTIGPFNEYKDVKRQISFYIRWSWDRSNPFELHEQHRPTIAIKADNLSIESFHTIAMDLALAGAILTDCPPTVAEMVFSDGDLLPTYWSSARFHADKGDIEYSIYPYKYPGLEWVVKCADYIASDHQLRHYLAMHWNEDVPMELDIASAFQILRWFAGSKKKSYPVAESAIKDCVPDLDDAQAENCARLMVMVRNATAHAEAPPPYDYHCIRPLAYWCVINEIFKKVGRPEPQSGASAPSIVGGYDTALLKEYLRNLPSISKEEYDRYARSTR